MEIKLPAITRAKIVLTERCQLNCKYCYEDHGSRKMDLDTAKSIIDLLYQNSQIVDRLPEINFFGGEPLLVYEELMKPCIEYIRGKYNSRYGITFTTNGILLDEEKLKYLKSNNVKFMLSIDGCEAAHDAGRIYHDGSGSFKDVAGNIENILKYFPSTMPRMTVTPENVSYLYKSVRYIADRGFSDMHIIPNLHIATSSIWDEESFGIAKEQLSLIADYIIDEFENDNIPIVFRTLADMFPRAVLSAYSARVNHHRVAACCSPLCRCGIGVLNNVIVSTDGNFFSCLHGSQEAIDSNVLYLGNIHEGISEERRLQLLKMNERELVSQSLNCKDCSLNDVCTGGCAPNNYSITGDFTVVSTNYCIWTQLLYDTAVSIIEHFDKDQNNELFKDYFYGVVKRGVSCVC